jgi:hypothetical protein
MSSDADQKVLAKPFPVAEVTASLLAELTLLAESEAQVRGLELPKAPGALLKMAIPLDSLSVVDVLCSVEPVLGVPLKDSLVRTGGYGSIEAAIDHLMPRLEAVWTKQNGGAA